MTERLRTGIKLAVAGAVIAMSGYAIGLSAGPADDLPEPAVAVGKSERVITISDRGIRPVRGCDKDDQQRTAASPAHSV